MINPNFNEQSNYTAPYTLDSVMNNFVYKDYNIQNNCNYTINEEDIQYYIDSPLCISTQYSLREEKEANAKRNITSKIEELFLLITTKLAKEEQLELFIIDLDQNSEFYYDYGYYRLPEDAEKIKYNTLNLYKNSSCIAKIVKVCSIIYAKLMKNRATNKR